jgi:cytochrome c-type biogenesis protein CcmH/NrfF
MNAKRILPLVLALAALAWGDMASAQAQYERPPADEGPYERHPEAVEAIRQLKSPYCPGLMLEVCPSGGGAALRDSIENLADSGWASAEIVEWVIGRHGESYRAVPLREGAGLLAWLMPPAGVLLGLGILLLALRRMHRKREEQGPPVEHEAPSPEEEQRLQEALRELEEEEEAPFL